MVVIWKLSSKSFSSQAGEPEIEMAGRRREFANPSLSLQLTSTTFQPIRTSRQKQADIRKKIRIINPISDSKK